MKINFQKKNYIVIWILLLIGITGFFAYNVYSKKNEQRSLERDFKSLYNIAQNLGFENSSQLNYKRSFYDTFMVHYYYLELLYSSKLSLEEFSQKINSLGFKNESEAFTQTVDTNYMHYYDSDSNNLKFNLELKKIDDLNRLHPKVTKWIFFHPIINKRLTIYFAEPHEGEVWLYNKQPIDGNIIEIELNRQ